MCRHRNISQTKSHFLKHKDTQSDICKNIVTILQFIIIILQYGYNITMLLHLSNPLHTIYLASELLIYIGTKGQETKKIMDTYYADAG